jgi:hypothetical protein
MILKWPQFKYYYLDDLELAFGILASSSILFSIWKQMNGIDMSMAGELNCGHG